VTRNRTTRSQMIRLRFVTHHYRHENDMTWWEEMRCENPMDYAHRMFRSPPRSGRPIRSRICQAASRARIYEECLNMTKTCWLSVKNERERRVLQGSCWLTSSSAMSITDSRCAKESGPFANDAAVHVEVGDLRKSKGVVRSGSRHQKIRAFLDNRT
jgi:hypothetical protein